MKLQKNLIGILFGLTNGNLLPKHKLHLIVIVKDLVNLIIMYVKIFMKSLLRRLILFLTILFSFVYLGFLYLTEGAGVVDLYEQSGYLLSGYVWFAFSTYYINSSIYLVFAMTYPNDVVRLYFLIPIKMKWLGIVDVIYMGYLLIVGGPYTRFAVLAAIINCLIFYIANIKGIAISPKQIKRHNEFNRSYRQGQNAGYKQTGFQAGGQTQTYRGRRRWRGYALSFLTCLFSQGKESGIIQNAFLIGIKHQRLYLTSGSQTAFKTQQTLKSRRRQWQHS